MKRLIYPFLHSLSNILCRRFPFTLDSLREVFIHWGCSPMTVSGMIQELVTCLTHNLRCPIWDSSDLVEMLPTLCSTLTFKDIAPRSSTKVCLQPPFTEIVIHFFCPENKRLILLCRANAFKVWRDRYRRLRRLNDRCGNRGQLAVWRSIIDSCWRPLTR